MKLKLRYTKLPLRKAQLGLPNFNPDQEAEDFLGIHPKSDMKMGMINPFMAAQSGSDNPFGSTANSQGTGFTPIAQPSLQFNTTFPVQVNQNLSRDPGVADALQSFSQASQDPAVQNFDQRKFLRGTVKDMRNRIREGTTDETRDQFRDYRSWVNQTAPLISAEDKQKMFKTAKGISTGADILSGISTGLDYINQRKKFKEFDRSMRDRAFDITPTAGQEFEGNYDVNSGMFQPYRIFNPNEGQFAENGGQINNTMKIRITGTPVQQMAYGGQSNYGLDLGRKKVYADMPEGRSESVSGSISAVPRDMANIEAEGGETVYGDLDGDGGLEHLKIQGKRHTQGGVPLNVPEGSFIFSDTKKMKIKDPAILAKFAATYKKGGVTPAALAKKYDINKYKAIMEDPNADALSKATAQMMVKNYQNKLGQLALVQEGMKGFPGGIPQVAQNALPKQMATAKFGGPLYKYQGANNPSTVGVVEGTPQYSDWTKGYDDFTTLYRNAENEKLRKALYAKYLESVRSSKGTPLSEEDFNNNFLEAQRQLYGINQKYKDNQEVLRSEDWDAHPTEADINKRYLSEAKTLGYNPLNRDQIRAFQQGYRDLQTLVKTNPDFYNSFGQFIETDPRGVGDETMELDGKTYNISPVDGILGNTTLGQFTRMRAKQTPPPPKSDPVPGYKCVDDGQGGSRLESKTFESEQQRAAEGYYAQAPTSCSPGKTETGTSTRYRDRFKFTNPDKAAMLAASMFSPKAYFPWSPDLEFRPNQLALQDWQAQTQNIYQGVNTAANTLGNFQPGQATASNLAFLQGQAADQIGKTMAATDAGNVDRFNQFSLREGARKDFVNQFNQRNRTDLFDKGVTTKQNFFQESMDAANNLVKTYANAHNNRMNFHLLNKINPIYNIDPETGYSYFMNGYGPEYFSKVSNPNFSGGFDWKGAQQAFQEARRYNPDLAYNTFLSYQYPNRRSVDRDGDGLAESSSTTTRVARKKGGQVNPLIEYLKGGFAFDPRGY